MGIKIHCIIKSLVVNNCIKMLYRICGVYRDAGLMCHDCVPNTHHAISMMDDHKMIVRSSIPIRKGEMITTSYADQLYGTRERRGFLKETKYFDCLCKRCHDPTEFATYISAVKCTGCSTGYLLPKDSISEMPIEWTCTNTSEDRANNNTDTKSANGGGQCRKSMKDEQVQVILRKVKKDIDEVSRSTAGSPVSRLERLLKKYSGKVVHPNHQFLLGVIKSLNYAYAKLHEATGGGDGAEMDFDHLSRAKALCLQLLGVLDMTDPGLTRLRGVLFNSIFPILYPIFWVNALSGF